MFAAVTGRAQAQQTGKVYRIALFNPVVPVADQNQASKGGSYLVLDVKAATSTIPVVGVFGDPVLWGIASNLARPGGNITGVSVYVGWDQRLKRFELLKEAVPQITRVGYLESRNSREGFAAPRTREAALRNSLSIVGPPLERPTDARVPAGICSPR
jgi:hypothetical protein